VLAMTFPSCLSVVIGTFDDDDDVDSCGAAADDDVDSCDAAADDDVVAGESLGVADEAVLTGAGATGSVVGVQAPVSVVDSVVNLVIDDAVVAFSLTRQENYFFPFVNPKQQTNTIYVKNPTGGQGFPIPINDFPAEIEYF